MMGLTNKVYFQLPDEWEPEGTACARITIPNDQQFFGQLIGLVDYLKWSSTFERDPTGQGAATVARTWKAAIESQPIHIDYTGECEEMPLILRQNPDDPCQLEQSTDGGENWTLAFDYGLCSTVPPVPQADDIADTMDGIIEFQIGWIDIVANNPGLPADDLAVLLLDYVKTFDPDFEDDGSLEDAIEQAMSEGSIEDYLEPCVYREEFDKMVDCMGQVNNLVDLLNGMSQCLIDTLNELSDEMIKVLMGLTSGFSQGGLNRFYEDRTAGSGAGFMGECKWTYEMDLTASDGGFKAIAEGADQGCPLGAWTTGIGWHDTGGCTTPPGNPGVTLAIYRTVPTSAKISRIEFEPVYTVPSATESYGIVVNGNEDCTVTVPGTGSAVYVAEDYPECPDVTVVKLAAYNGNFSGIIFDTILWEGYGKNPFA